MHPNQYVYQKIKNGEFEIICKMLFDYSDQIGEVGPSFVPARSFIKAFILGLASEIKENKIEDLENRPYFTVWSELGFIGIDRAKINLLP